MKLDEFLRRETATMKMIGRRNSCWDQNEATSLNKNSSMDMRSSKRRVSCTPMWQSPVYQCLSGVSEDQGNLKVDYSKNNMFFCLSWWFFPNSFEPKKLQQIYARQIGEHHFSRFQSEQINKHIWNHLSHEKNPYYFPLYWLFNYNPNINA